MASLASSPLIAVGQTIGNYTITAKLGEGGMGVVYLAEHPVIGRKVAMKAIHPELSRNPEVVSRFVTEAKAVNQIGNEHIVDIHDFGTTPDGDFYFIMEFLQGEALSDRIKREAPLDPARALDIAAQVADALAASHAHGIIHRDLKPENIFLIHKGNTNDFVKVLDFGLAKLTSGDDKVSHKTRTGSVMGTPYYMSPEQCEGRPNIDHRADVYSLGVILFEMMTRQVPFGGEGYGEIIVKHITAPVPSAARLQPAAVGCPRGNPAACPGKEPRRAVPRNGRFPGGDARSRAVCAVAFNRAHARPAFWVRRRRECPRAPDGQRRGQRGRPRTRRGSGRPRGFGRRRRCHSQVARGVAGRHFGGRVGGRRCGGLLGGAFGIEWAARDCATSCQRTSTRASASSTCGCSRAASQSNDRVPLRTARRRGRARGQRRAIGRDAL